MLGIAYGLADGRDEGKNQHHEQSCQSSNAYDGCREDGIGLEPLVVGKAEQRCLHTKGQYHQNQRSIGIHVCTDTIVARILGHIVRIERHKQIIQKPANDAAQAVDGRILCQ